MKKQCKVRILVFVFILVANVMLSKNDIAMSMKEIFLEKRRPVIDFDERISSQDQEENVLPKRNEEAWVIKKRTTKMLFR